MARKKVRRGIGIGEREGWGRSSKMKMEEEGRSRVEEEGGRIGRRRADIYFPKMTLVRNISF